MEAATIVGFVAAASVINNLITTAGKGGVEACVNAYYADKYNGDKYGNPEKTFVNCMAATYPDTFKAVRARYNPTPGAAAAAGSS